MADSKGTMNKVILIGRLGQDPNMKYTPSGTAVVDFSVATNETWKSKDGDKNESTDWHRIQAWGKLAEIVGEWVTKGQLVCVVGRIKYGEYTDDNGVKRYTTTIRADQIQMLGSKQNGSSGQDTKKTENTSPKEEEDDLPF